jgi:hypothetical protein
MSAATISSTVSVRSPAPEDLVIRAELVDAPIDFGQQHQLLVGVERRDERRLPYNFG